MVCHKSFEGNSGHGHTLLAYFLFSSSVTAVILDFPNADGGTRTLSDSLLRINIFVTPSGRSGTHADGLGCDV